MPKEYPAQTTIVRAKIHIVSSRPEPSMNIKTEWQMRAATEPRMREDHIRIAPAEEGDAVMPVIRPKQ